MSEPKFTPGPWFRKGKRVYWKKPEKDLPHGTLPNGQICLCKSAEDWPECEEEARANAQLISTAPELYDALHEASDGKCWSCAGVNAETVLDNGCPKGNNGNCYVAKWIELLRKVRDGK